MTRKINILILCANNENIQILKGVKIVLACIKNLDIKNRNEIFNTSNHSIITWEQYKKNPSHWFVNHPTVCYRKSKVIEAGNYNPDIKVMTEDFDLELRMLKKYGMIFNFKEALIYYRIHTDQVTHNPSQEWIERRNKMINDLINE